MWVPVVGMGKMVLAGVDDMRLAWGTAGVPAVLKLEALVRVAADSAGQAAARREDTQLRLPARRRPEWGMRFKRVTFRYPSAEADTFADMDLFIPAGRSLAVVGLNGAGKTTLAKLTCCLYEPRGARITVDGAALR